jgi:hypothetical protein
MPPSDNMRNKRWVTLMFGNQMNQRKSIVRETNHNQKPLDNVRNKR